MGFKVSWIARAGTSTTEILSVLKLDATSNRSKYLDVGFHLLETHSADGDPWVILVADGYESINELDQEKALSLSLFGSDVLYFCCLDTVMATDIKYFSKGANLWSIEYNSEEEAAHPSLTGDYPAVTNKLLSFLRARQEADSEADYIYELTTEVGRHLTGFRHDEDPDTDERYPFVVLTR